MVKLTHAFVLLALGCTSALAVGGSCTFTSASAAMAGKSKYSKIILSNIVVPAKTTLDLTGLDDNTEVIFDGKTTFGYAPWADGPMISVSGTGIRVSETSGSVIDCGGERWWDGKGGNGGKEKPKFFSAYKLINSHIGPLTVKNTPVQAFSINQANSLTLDHITMDNSDGDVDKQGHNTDAFDVGSSTGVYITNANVKNQDDCLAVNSGKDILFSGGVCSGGHGLSIGSVGGRSDNVVDGVRIENSHVINSDNSVRIKTLLSATGTVNNVTYTGITMNNIAKYGIVVVQNYKNSGGGGTPTNGVTISNVNIKDVTGSVNKGATAVEIVCGSSSCEKWKWSGNDVRGCKKSAKCQDVPKPASY